MNHVASATTPSIAPSTDDRARASRERKRALRDRPVSGLGLTLHIVGVAALVVASVGAIADQSTRFVSGQEIVGVHEIPAFIAGRVELTPGLTPDNPALDVGAPGGRGAPADLSARQRMAGQG